MKIVLLLLVLSAVVFGRTLRKRQASEILLPDGVELLLSAPLTTNFRCPDSGYYADVDNNCQIFHICDLQTRPDGVSEIRQYSFACGNQTMFNQLTMTCATPEESVPCDLAPQFYVLNQKLGRVDEPIHTEEELAYAAQVIPAQAARLAV